MDNLGVNHVGELNPAQSYQRLEAFRRRKEEVLVAVLQDTIRFIGRSQELSPEQFVLEIQTLAPKNPIDASTQRMFSQIMPSVVQKVHETFETWDQEKGEPIFSQFFPKLAATTHVPQIENILLGFLAYPRIVHLIQEFRSQGVQDAEMSAI